MNNTDQKWKALLEKWNSGNFTRADEEALQRLLAEGDDAFLREATEGYWANNEADHQARLASLRERLSFTEVAPRRSSWQRWAVAAASLVLLGGIWWLVRMPSEQPITGRLPIDQPVADTPSAAVPDRGAAKAKTTAPQAAPGTMADAAPQKASDLAMENTTQALPPTSIQNDAAAVEEPSEVAGVAAPPSPTVQNDILEPEQKEYANQDFSKKRAANQSPVPTPNNTKSSQSNTNYPTQTRNAVKTQPQPEGGWEKFKADMEKEMNMPQAARDNGVKSGVVNMILDIKPTDGKVRSVLFINRLGFGCDELAEQFVRRYTWVITPGGPTQIEVEVEFQ